MSQSETWDRLREAADWRDDGPPQQVGMERYAVARPEMPEPEAKWVRRTSNKTAKNVIWRMLAKEVGVSPDRVFLNPSTYERIRRGMDGTPYSPRFLLRAGLIAALIALPGYRDA